MISNVTSRTRRVAGVFALAALAGIGIAPKASAYVLKHTKSGAEMRWSASSVDFAVSPTIAAIPHATEAVPAVFASWSGAPAMRAVGGAATDMPGYDRKNIVYFAEHGFAPAGDALAITVLTSDTNTGALLDADIVLNGRYVLRVIGAGGNDDSSEKTYDVVHVLAHEMGHALGLDHETQDAGALMFPTTRPNDATLRSPAADDLAGIAKLYVASANASTNAPAPGSATGSHGTAHGCGGATIATRNAGGFGAGSLALGAAGLIALFVASRRRSARRLGTTLSMMAFAALAFHATPATARSAAPPGAHARAQVVSAEPTWQGGLLQTTVTLHVNADDCFAAACPDVAETTVWGGVAGSITQQIGDHRAPQVGDMVDVAFEAAPAKGRAVATIVHH